MADLTNFSPELLAALKTAIEVEEAARAPAPQPAAEETVPADILHAPSQAEMLAALVRWCTDRVSAVREATDGLEAAIAGHQHVGQQDAAPLAVVEDLSQTVAELASRVAQLEQRAAVTSGG